MIVFIWYALLYVHSCFAIIFTRKRELVALLLLSLGCLVTVNVLRLFLTVSWGGLQCVIVVFSDQTHLRFDRSMPNSSFGCVPIIHAVIKCLFELKS